MINWNIHLLIIVSLTLSVFVVPLCIQSESFINNQYLGLYEPIKWLNMITEKQLKLFEVFAKKPFAEHMRKEIKKESKEKSNNKLALVINQLKKENVLIERKIGKSGLLTLNLENDLTFYYLALSNDNRINRLAKIALESLKKEIAEDTPFYSIVIFGSYAANEQKKGSDLDIAIFIENEGKRKQIEASANSAKLKSILEMDVHIIPKAEMLDMLTNKEENLGKQIARKHLAVHNQGIFYNIIKEGMNHGFRI
ncbi:nucleotidyltransferase domain-containing protein [Candidatus Woesearchaeota archaeon]|nr:nucleotidyltransferase domain-containing protein [Candidatus Woesearchaeota archaeon]